MSGSVGDLGGAIPLGRPDQPAESVPVVALPARVDSWSLTSLKQWLVKTGGRPIRHSRYYWLLLAESHLTRRLLCSMVAEDPYCRRQRDKSSAERSRFQ